MRGRCAKVRFASNKDDGNGGTTNSPYFFYPLAKLSAISTVRYLMKDLNGVRTFVVTFSNESGVSRANAMRMTCDFEYDIGRRRCKSDRQDEDYGNRQSVKTRTSYSSCPL